MKTAKKYPPLTQNKFIRQFLLRDSFEDLGDRLAEINENKRTKCSFIKDTGSKKQTVITK